MMVNKTNQQYVFLTEINHLILNTDLISMIPERRRENTLNANELMASTDRITAMQVPQISDIYIHTLVLW